MRTELKVLRVKYNLTQQKVAAHLGVSVSTYNLIENGKRNGNKSFWQGVQTLFKLEDGQVWQLMQNNSI